MRSVLIGFSLLFSITSFATQFNCKTSTPSNDFQKSEKVSVTDDGFSIGPAKSEYQSYKISPGTEPDFLVAEVRFGGRIEDHIKTAIISVSAALVSGDEGQIFIEINDDTIEYNCKPTK